MSITTTSPDAGMRALMLCTDVVAEARRRSEEFRTH
jgi:hypothetical protein